MRMIVIEVPYGKALIVPASNAFLLDGMGLVTSEYDYQAASGKRIVTERPPAEIGDIDLRFIDSSEVKSWREKAASQEDPAPGAVVDAGAPGDFPSVVNAATSLL